MNQKKHRSKHRQIRRRYTDESEDEAVQLMQHGHSGPSVMERLGLPSAPCCNRSRNASHTAALFKREFAEPPHPEETETGELLGYDHRQLWL